MISFYFENGAVDESVGHESKRLVDSLTATLETVTSCIDGT